MTRRKQKIEPEEVGRLEEVIETSNDPDVIETLLETAVKSTEVNSNDDDVPNNNDAILPRSASRYVHPLR